MRKTILAALCGLTYLYAGTATADFYVVQNAETGKCSIEQELPSSASTQILLNNMFNERADAEQALKDIPACN